MAVPPDLSQPFLIAIVADSRIAIPAQWAEEMIVCPDTVSIPTAPSGVRGIGMRRERAVTMFDARILLGLPARQTEVSDLLALLEARELDHVRWVDSLLHSIDTDTEFTLARDPHQCAFGQWYDTYEAPTASLRRQMAKFKSPHEAVHALADQADQVKREFGRTAAIELIETFRVGSLVRMRKLFSDTRQLLLEEVREITVIHGSRWGLLGLIVDGIESVELLNHDTLENLSGRMPAIDERVTSWSARTSKDVIVMLPDMDALLDGGVLVS